jgi:hypothetical protein
MIRLRSYDFQSLFTSFDMKSWNCEIQAKNLLHNFLKLQLVENALCRNPTLAKCGGEAQHLEKLEVRSLSGLPNV